MAYRVTIHEVAIFYQASRLVGLAPDADVTAETYLYRAVEPAIEAPGLDELPTDRQVNLTPHRPQSDACRWLVWWT